MRSQNAAPPFPSLGNRKHQRGHGYRYEQRTGVLINCGSLDSPCWSRGRSSFEEVCGQQRCSLARHTRPPVPEELRLALGDCVGVPARGARANPFGTGAGVGSGDERPGPLHRPVGESAVLLRGESVVRLSLPCLCTIAAGGTAGRLNAYDDPGQRLGWEDGAPELAGRSRSSANL